MVISSFGYFILKFVPKPTAGQIPTKTTLLLGRFIFGLPNNCSRQLDDCRTEITSLDEAVKCWRLLMANWAHNQRPGQVKCQP
ncbi:hypothetical protein T4B_12601 [Trichinella pseudospiralis]|uniref:Uncharacterized protein n=1 Tax=Trichinella pseudospiralis TaxID=6337 RepID=A0A0V1HAB8_TRIPS|nr:hypothetical protein T4B_12601 [Trichinella pseudospiralis]